MDASTDSTLVHLAVLVSALAAIAIVLVVTGALLTQALRRARERWSRLGRGHPTPPLRPSAWNESAARMTTPAEPADG